jgi:hypothetical protein
MLAELAHDRITTYDVILADTVEDVTWRLGPTPVERGKPFVIALPFRHE